MLLLKFIEKISWILQTKVNLPFTEDWSNCHNNLVVLLLNLRQKNLTFDLMLLFLWSWWHDSFLITGFIYWNLAVPYLVTNNFRIWAFNIMPSIFCLLRRVLIYKNSQFMAELFSCQHDLWLGIKLIFHELERFSHCK